MNYTRDCYFRIDQAQAHLNVLQLICSNKNESQVEKNIAAYEIASAVKSALKYLMCRDGGHFLEAHDLETLVQDAARCEVQIPRNIYALLPVLYEYETKAQYSMDYKVTLGDLNEVFSPVYEWVLNLLMEFTDGAYEVLKGQVPPALLDSYKSKMHFVMDYAELLPKYA